MQRKMSELKLKLTLDNCPFPLLPPPPMRFLSRSIFLFTYIYIRRFGLPSKKLDPSAGRCIDLPYQSDNISCPFDCFLPFFPPCCACSVHPPLVSRARSLSRVFLIVLFVALDSLEVEHGNVIASALSGSGHGGRGLIRKRWSFILAPLFPLSLRAHTTICRR